MTLGKGAKWNRKTKWYKFRRITKGGLKRRTTTKEGTAPTLEQVMAAYRTWLAAPAGTVLTFREFAAGGWLTFCRNRKHAGKMRDSTIEFYENALATILRYVGDTPLPDFTASRIEDLAGTLQESGLSSTTARSYCQVVLRILRAAVHRGDLAALPSLVQLVLPSAQKPMNLLTVEDEGRLLAAATPEFRALLVLARTTGLRKSDLIALRWTSVDLDARVITLVQTKTKQTVAVPILARTREALLWCRERPVRAVDGHVLLDRRGRPWTKQTIKDSLASTKRRAGLADVPYRFHDARHAYGTQLAEANLALPVIATLLGHKDLKSSQRYMHPHPEVVAEQARTRLEPEPVVLAGKTDDTPGSTPT